MERIEEGPGTEARGAQAPLHAVAVLRPEGSAEIARPHPGRARCCLLSRVGARFGEEEGHAKGCEGHVLVVHEDHEAAAVALLPGPEAELAERALLSCDELEIHHQKC